MTAVSDETGREQAFERFPKLAGWIERLAGTQMDLSLKEWGEFLAELNVALSAAPVGEPALRMCGYCKTWNSKPCGEQCYLQPSDPVWTAPVAQEPVASDDPYFIMLWNWFEKRRGKEDMRAIQNDGGLSVDDLETMLDEHEADLLSQINTPPAPSAGVGADEIAQIIATKCFDPRVIDSSGKPFWKKSQWREAQQAANAILLLLSGGGSEVTHLRMPTQQQNI